MLLFNGNNGDRCCAGSADCLDCMISCFKLSDRQCIFGQGPLRHKGGVAFARYKKSMIVCTFRYGTVRENNLDRKIHFFSTMQIAFYAAYCLWFKNVPVHIA